MKRWLPALLWLALAACGSAPEPYDVLVLVPDTVRADHISANGYPRATTPVLDALARDGANFTQAITVAPRTFQSFASILTGLYPPHHGVRFVFDRPLTPDIPTLASELREHGYEVAAFDTLPFLSGMTAEGTFDTLVGPKTTRERPLGDREVVSRVSEWILRERDTPYLAFVRLTGAHWPYPPIEDEETFGSCAGYDHSFNERSLGLALGRLGAGMRVVDADAYRRNLWDHRYDEATLDHMIAHYDAGIRRFDALLGELLEALERAGRLERTIVVVTSDHGESFGEHGYLQHGPRVDDNVMRVPLVIRLPHGHPSARPGTVVDGLVRTVDLFPTLLEAVGATPPAGLDGVSLLPALRGEPLPARWAYGESGRSFAGLDPERHFPGVEGKRRMVRDTRHKLVLVPQRDGDVWRLYDLRDDPEERRDVASSAPEAVASLRERLETARANEIAEPGPKRPSRAEQRALRELGYAE